MGYLAKHNGFTRFNGKIVSYKKGYNDVKKGVLDHVGSCEWTDGPSTGKTKTTVVQKSESSDRKKPTSSNTVDEIKAYLDESGTEYTSTMKKSELLDLV